MTRDRVDVTGKGGGPITIVAVRDLIRDLLLREDKPIEINAKPIEEQGDRREDDGGVLVTCGKT